MWWLDRVCEAPCSAGRGSPPGAPGPTKDEHQGGDEDPLVGPHDGHGPPQPGLGAGRGRRWPAAPRSGPRTGTGMNGDSATGSVSAAPAAPPGHARITARPRAFARGGPAWPPATGPGPRGPGGRCARRAGSSAISQSRPSTAASAAPSTRRPSAVSTWETCRRSSSEWRRATRPRATRPSTTAVTLGGRTASRSARADDTLGPSSRSHSTRYWGSERSTSFSPSSTCLASQAAVRPRWPAPATAGRCSGDALRPT